MTRVLSGFLLLTAGAMSQQWEAGAFGGFSYTPQTSVTNPAGSASAGFRNAPMFGFFAGSNDYRYLSGEASYMYRQADVRVTGNGREATLGAHTQFLDFRFLVHFAERGARIRPFVAVGGGVAVYSGTGSASASQPLNSFVALTNTRETKPMASGAAGVKVRLSRHLGLRFEFREYATPFPNRLMAPAPGASLSGWVHNLSGLGGITAHF